MVCCYLRVTRQRLTYVQIADDVQRRIRAGEYPRRSRIPSYSGLSRQYQVSPRTVQRAVSLLRELNLVRGVPGRGVYVR